NAGALDDAIQDTLDKTIQTGFTQDEVDQAVTSLLQYMELGRSSEASLAWRWAGYLANGRSFAWQARMQEKLQQLSAADVNQAMREFLKPAAMGIAIAADPV